MYRARVFCTIAQKSRARKEISRSPRLIFPRTLYPFPYPWRHYGVICRFLYISASDAPFSSIQSMYIMYNGPMDVFCKFEKIFMSKFFWSSHIKIVTIGAYRIPISSNRHKYVPCKLDTPNEMCCISFSSLQQYQPCLASCSTSCSI